MEQPLNNKPRIDVVDALRGFSVLAILLVHNLEHFIYAVYPTDSPTWLATMDKSVHSIIFTLFAGKAYAIFALLFGLTFYIQYTNQQKKGNDFSYRFLWRLILLMVFATLNAAFFPAGDVLLLFAVVGIILFITRKWNDKAILITSIILLLQPLEWYHYVASSIDPMYQIPDLGVGAMYEQVGESTKSGELGQFLWCNITLGQKASFLWAVDAGRFVQTAGLFLLGAYIGRKNLFSNTPQNLQTWVKILVGGAIIFAPLYVLNSELLADNPELKKTIGTVLTMWQNLAYSFILIASFVLLYQIESFSSLVSNLRLYGKMSLTNYVSQSIIGAIIYFPIGLNLVPYCGSSVSLFIGLVTFLLQIKFSEWWLSNHKQGPLEYIWHRCTWIH